VDFQLSEAGPTQLSSYGNSRVSLHLQWPYTLGVLNTTPDSDCEQIGSEADQQRSRSRIFHWVIFNILLPVTPVVVVCLFVKSENVLPGTTIWDAINSVVGRGDLFLAAGLTSLVGLGEQIQNKGRRDSGVHAIGTLGCILGTVCGLLGYVNYSKNAALLLPNDANFVTRMSVIVWIVAAISSGAAAFSAQAIERQ
jgi:hypothetical protein